MSGRQGNEVRKQNSNNHQARVGYERPWNLDCAGVDVEALRVRMSVEYVRARGGLTYEERILLRGRVAEIQRAKEKRDRRLLRDYWAA